jgi:hypothetical protein
MKPFALKLLLACFALLSLAAPTQAQFNFLPEVRAGISARGVDSGENLLDPERISDANVELLFAVPDLNAWSVIGELRPHLGATMSFRDGDHYGYAGLSWTFQAPVLPVFVEASAGGVVRSGLFEAEVNAPERAAGCNLGARVAGSVGLNLPLGASLIGTVEHLPQWGCDLDRASTNVGIRLGLRF